MRTGKLCVLLMVIATLLVSSSCTVIYDPPPTPVPMSAKACKYVEDGFDDLAELALVTGATKTSVATKLVADARKNVEGALADYAAATGWTPASINLDENGVPLIDPKTGLPFDPPDPWAASECAAPSMDECISPCCPFWVMENTVNNTHTKLLGDAADIVAATSADFLNAGVSLIPGAETCTFNTP